MTMIRYNGWQTPQLIQNEMRNVFDKLFNADEGDQSNIVTSQWTPRVDIREEAERFVILADIPGVDPKDIEIHMEKGVLTLRGERSGESKEETDRYTRVERHRGTFYRRFALPDTANPDGITATGRHGTLEIAIPKKPETKPRRISIATE